MSNSCLREAHAALMICYATIVDVHPGSLLKARIIVVQDDSILPILNENPLVDIRSIQPIHTVVLKGKLFGRKCLDVMLSSVRSKASQ